MSGLSTNSVLKLSLFERVFSVVIKREECCLQCVCMFWFNIDWESVTSPFLSIGSSFHNSNYFNNKYVIQ